MTLFVRLFDLPTDAKHAALTRAVTAIRNREDSSALPTPIFTEKSSETFKQVPGSPFAYWISDHLREVFVEQSPLQGDGREAAFGGSTKDDKRYLRLWFEVRSENFSPNRDETSVRRWVLLVKGGAWSTHYADVYLALNWHQDGYELKVDIAEYRGSRGWGYQWTAALNGYERYFRMGLTWSRRTQRGFGVRVMPSGCVFADKGPAIFVKNNDIDRALSLLSVVTSSTFCVFVELQMAFGSYEVGVIQRTPVPDLKPDQVAILAPLARRAWSLKRSIDTVNETSHAFLLPPGLNEKVTGLNPPAVHDQLAAIQRDIDDQAFTLYGISPEDRAAIEASSNKAPSSASTDDPPSSTDEDPEEPDEEEETPAAPPAATLHSWLLGVAFGRFDPRLATGERPIPPEPEPFDPLPARSPGMWPEGDPAKPTFPTLLVDDPGHKDDITRHVLDAAARAKLPDPHDLRPWLAKEFFPLHIKMYSKSRRKAPIYWQLSTPSAGYSVWLYLHALSTDTFFRIQNDYVIPKLAHEERRLYAMGEAPRTAADRRAQTDQQTLVDELRGFLDEVKRIAPLWSPNLDDGVLLNFAPLYRLVPHHKPWQKELKAAWDSLCAGDYDWAHLAMHLWPERVVPRCAKDRSLAIAHGLEEVFWAETTAGKWAPRKTPTRPVDDIIQERTSPAVKAALKSLLDAPAASGAPKKTRKGKASA
ncbi:MAG: hypothetical protein U0359_13480 [Byssovorax sp.]